MVIKAIPTQYNRVNFRSRLEASWARHFDSMKLPWKYEPRHFKLSSGQRYLPDFYFPTARAWVEVKGAHNERIDKFECFAADMWRQSGAHDTYDTKSPMILKLVLPETCYDKTRLAFPLNVMGPGKAGSAVFTICNECRQTTVVSLWQRWCRNCGFVVEGDAEAYEDEDDWKTFRKNPVLDFWMPGEFKLLDINFNVVW